MALKQLPIGISDYKEIIEEHYLYIDKTLLIKDVCDSGKVVLVPRPRRFGKTLNLSMLRYFFEASEQSNTHLFSDKKIWENPEYHALQGKFPVIYVTFKNIKEISWEVTYEKFAYTIYEEYARHKNVLFNDALETYEKDLYIRFLERKASQAELENSLQFLAKLLYKKYNKRVIILIDEYDVPIQSAYVHGYYTPAIEFEKGLLTAVLKDSQILEKGVVTGILTLAKAGIFSGLNNLDVYNLTNEGLSDKFGFTHDEVAKLLSQYGLQKEQEAIAAWYDGYTFGATRGMYNPWSVLKCVQKNGALEKYWANTSDNLLVKKLIACAPKSVKSELALLLENKNVEQTIVESITFPDLDQQTQLVWSLLLFTGYLTYTNYKLVAGAKVCSLAIPNKEVKYLYIELIQNIFNESVVGGQAEDLLQALTQGDAETFAELLQNFILNSMSAFDLPDNEPEKSYHLFILGLLVMLSDRYEVKSNRESGLGRYDIMLIPKDSSKPAIVMEFKKVTARQTLEAAAQNALDQIIEMKYIQELHQRGFTKIILYGVAFEGKNSFLKMKKI